jgi:hypothetical protein
MNSAVFWAVKPCSFVRTDNSEETYRLHHQGEENQARTANFVLNPLILFTLMMEAIRSFYTSVLTRVTQRHIPEYGILYFLTS